MRPPEHEEPHEEDGLQMPPFPPPEPKNPFELFILIWIFLASTALTTGNPGSAVLKESLDETTVVAWGAAAFIGSGMSLMGIFIQRWTRDGLVMERTGMILVGGAAAVYAYVIYQSAAFADIRYILGIQIGIAGASLWRAWHITRRLRWIRGQRDGG